MKTAELITELTENMESADMSLPFQILQLRLYQSIVTKQT